MDQREQELQELNKLWDHIQLVKSLEKKIEGNNQRVRAGVSDKYVNYNKKPANEEKKRKEQCRNDNLAKVPAKEKAWKISRICLVILFFVAVAVITIIDPTFFTASRNGSYSLIGGIICIGYWIATVFIINNIDDTGYNFSAKQKAWIAEGARMDQATKEKNRATFEAVREKSYKEQRELLDKLQKDLEKYEKELAQHRQAIAESDVVGDDDKNAATVYFLIDQLETKQASSVQDAFLQRDAKKKQEEEKRAKEEEQKAILARYQFMYDLQQQAEGQRAVREAEAYMRQTFHNIEMQKQARRQAEELERIRKELENSK